MSVTTELKNEIEKGLRTFKAFENGQKALSLLEGIEQNVSETERRLKSLKEEEDSIVERLDEAKKVAADLKEKSESAAKDALSKASSLAAEMVSAAKAEIKSLNESAKKMLDDQMARNAIVKFSNNELDGKISQKKGELAAIQDALNQHKDALKKFLK